MACGGQSLRRAFLISVDVLLVAFATVLAILLRDNFDIAEEKIPALAIYVLISCGVTLIIFLAGGLDRTLWRYASVGDHLHAVVLCALVVLTTVVLTFASNRLEGIARSLPVLQVVLTACRSFLPVPLPDFGSQERYIVMGMLVFMGTRARRC